jgi:hypothetical protein
MNIVINKSALIWGENLSIMMERQQASSHSLIRFKNGEIDRYTGTPHWYNPSILHLISFPECYIYYYREEFKSIRGVQISMNANHKTIKMFNPFYSEYQKIDRNIAKLIECLWKLNIFTVCSCEDNVPKDYIWIEFGSGDNAECFLQIVGNYFYHNPKEGIDNGEGLYHRMKEEDVPNKWLYACGTRDDSEHLEGDWMVYGEDFKGLFITISIRFHKQDYPMILEALNNKLKQIG